MSKDKSKESRFPAELKLKGYLSVESQPESGPEKNFELLIAPDGRVWININGVCFLRFKPQEEEPKDDKA